MQINASFTVLKIKQQTISTQDKCESKSQHIVNPAK